MLQEIRFCNTAQYLINIFLIFLRVIFIRVVGEAVEVLHSDVTKQRFGGTKFILFYLWH